MNYIIVLNWNSYSETIECVKSLLNLNNYEDVKIIICDNNSSDCSYDKILNYLEENHNNNFLNITECDILNTCKKAKFYLIQNFENYGYAGGNNIGIKFALNDSKMEFVWVLNNDTIVESDTLTKMIEKFKKDKSVGICGSKLIDFHDRNSVQAIGGLINPWFCTTKPIGSHLKKSDRIDEKDIEAKIDYVVGASLLFSREFLENVGLLCEEFFLYYEEIDICNRARFKNYKVALASDSIVYHIQGVSTSKGMSDISDYYMVSNRLRIAKKYYPSKVFTVKLSMVLVILNRLRRFKMKNVIKFLGLFFK